jgi:hypothetical protein
MGSIKQRGNPTESGSTAKPIIRKKPGAPAAEVLPRADAVMDLQRWLLNAGLIAPTMVTGRYSKNTHQALENLYSSYSKSEEPQAVLISGVLKNYLDKNTVVSVGKNPAPVNELLFQLQRVLKQQPASVSADEQDTPYIKVNIGGAERMLPIALIWNRGYKMYQAILEREGIIDMSQPVEQRIAALNGATRAIISAVQAQYPNNINLANMMNEAYADLLNEWRGAAQSASTQGAFGTLVDAINSWSETSAFRKIPDAQRARIISAIYYSFPHADKFMESPPNVNSKITDVAELRRNRASIIAIVQAHLRDLGYRV